MDRTIHIPIDVESRTEFRMLEQRLCLVEDKAAGAGKARAFVALFLLFRDLGYAAEILPEGVKLGSLTEQQGELLQGALESALGLDGRQVMMFLGDSFLREPHRQDEPRGQGEPRWFCELFAKENEHLDRNYKTAQSKGGHARGLKFLEARALEDGIKQAAILKEELFHAPGSGGAKVAIPPDEVKKLMMLIKLLDNVAGRPKGRLSSEYTAGLIAGAHRVIKEFPEEEIKSVSGWIHLHRGKPGCPDTTEKILGEFETWVKVAKG